MYVPEHFEQTHIEEIHRIMTDYPLGTLVFNGPNGLDANHLPFELNPEAGEWGQLIAHVARANTVWTELRDGDEVLVIFRAGDAYISPNWYPSKHEAHRQVPTWNYQVVHVHGKVKIRDDERFVRGAVARLTRAHEDGSTGDRPWKMTDSPKEFIDEMLKAIVGLEIDVVNMVGKSKLGQNKDRRDRDGAAEELRNRGDELISTEMLKAASHDNGEQRR